MHYQALGWILPATVTIPVPCIDTVFTRLLSGPRVERVRSEAARVRGVLDELASDVEACEYVGAIAASVGAFVEKVYVASLCGEVTLQFY